jgi:hypothetical protein
MHQRRERVFVFKCVVMVKVLLYLKQEAFWMEEVTFLLTYHLISVGTNHLGR